MAKLNVVIPATNVIVDGVEYRKVDREAQAGDIVRITDEDALDSSYVTHNGFYRVNRLDFLDDPQIKDNDGDEFDLCGWTYEVYEKVETVPVPKRLTIGDYAKVIAKGTHDYEVGSVVKITVDENDFQPYKAERVDGTVGNWLREREIVRATDEEVAAAKAALDPRNQFVKGDKVRLVSGGRDYPLNGYDNGKVYGVTEPTRHDGEPGTVEIKGGSVRTGYAKPYQLVKVTAEELAQEALTAKWAAIGRKVDEYKTGDVVRVLEDRSAAGVKSGDLEVVKSTEFGLINDGVRLEKMNPSDMNAWMAVIDIELVTPVEQRFDRVG